MCHFFVSYAMPQFRLLLYSIYAYFTITLRCYDKLWFGFIRSHHLVLPLSSTTFELNTKSERARKRESEKKIKKYTPTHLHKAAPKRTSWLVSFRIPSSKILLFLCCGTFNEHFVQYLTYTHHVAVDRFTTIQTYFDSESVGYSFFPFPSYFFTSTFYFTAVTSIQRIPPV